MSLTPIELKLRFERADFAAAAWFIPGSDASAWLSEIARWDASMESVQLLPVPDLQTVGAPRGVVVLGLTGRPHDSIAQPYRRVGTRLLAPLEAAVHPFVSDAEVDELLSGASVQQYVWHPSAGLIGYGADEIVGVDRLLGVPSPTESDWKHATAGVRLSGRLESIAAASDISLDDVIAGGQDDIGSKSDLRDAPRSPDESGTAGLRDAGKQMLRPFAKMAKWFADRAPATSDRRTWVNGLADWAGNVLREGAASQARRLNELKRLMQMLQNDPDKGLQYAVPFGGDPHRGLAQPTDHLQRRDVDFRLGGSSGGADYWDMPWDVRQRLMEQYRELAMREQHLGRYRRAAYIHAELLGDYAAAAGVLEIGGHFREAAVVFRDRLRLPTRAAACLVKAGLFEDALRIYEDIGDWEACARLYEQLDDAQRAAEAWKRAVAASELAGDHLQAARLLETRLCDPKAAAECLERGWDRARNSEKCLEELFRLFGRTENHTSASERIRQFVEARAEVTARQAIVAGTLARMSHEYPDAGVRDQSAAATRQLASRNLVTGMQASTFLAAVRALQPGDRLLERDCFRFNGKQTKSKRQAVALRSTVQFEHRFRLRDDVEWTAAASDGRRVFVGGFADDHLVLAHCDLKSPLDAPDYCDWFVRTGVPPRLLLAVRAQRQRPVMMHLVACPQLKDFTRKTGPLGSLVSNAPRDGGEVLSMAPAGSGGTWVLQAFVEHARGSVEFAASLYSPTDIPAGSHAIEWDPAWFKDLSELPDAFLTVASSRLCIVIARALVIQSPVSARLRSEVIPERPSWLESGHRELPGLAQGLWSSSSREHPAVAVTFEDGGLVHWLNTEEQQEFGAGLVRPVAQFSPHGRLIAADEHGIVEVYRTHNGRIDLTTTVTPHESRAIAVLTSHSNRFCLCYSDGTIDVHRLRK